MYVIHGSKVLHSVSYHLNTIDHTLKTSGPFLLLLFLSIEGWTNIHIQHRTERYKPPVLRPAVPCHTVVCTVFAQQRGTRELLCCLRGLFFVPNQIRDVCVNAIVVIIMTRNPKRLLHLQLYQSIPQYIGTVLPRSPMRLVVTNHVQLPFSSKEREDGQRSMSLLPNNSLLWRLQRDPAIDEIANVAKV